MRGFSTQSESLGGSVFSPMFTASGENASLSNCQIFLPHEEGEKNLAAGVVISLVEVQLRYCEVTEGHFLTPNGE